MAIGGTRVVSPYKSEAWSLMSKKSKDHMLGLTKAVRSFFDKSNTPRLEIHVQEEFKAAHKWAEMLGFDCETPNGMKHWGLAGETYYIYARCKC